MKRREMFQRIAGAVTAAGVTDVTLYATSEPTGKPALAVFETTGMLSSASAERIKEAWAQAVTGGAFEGVKAVVICDGIRLTLLDADGNVLNRAITDQTTDSE